MVTLIATLCLAGCSSSTVPESVETTNSTTAPVTSPAPPQPTDTAAAVPEPPRETVRPPEDPPQQQKGKKRTIAERTFQLKDLARVTVEVNGKKFKCWVMDTPEKIAEGMMHLQETDVEDDECMIFVFDPPRELGFWMRNCHYDIDVAFVGANKRILNTPRMRAYDETSIRSAGVAKYGIEFRAGMFKKWGIKAGQLVTIPDSVKFKSE